MGTVQELRTADELAAANRVVERAWRAAFGDIVSETTLDYVHELSVSAPTDSRLEAITGMDTSMAYIAVDDQVVVGNAWVLWDPDRMKPFVGSDDAELRLLYVDPDRWGQGIGTQLLDACLAAVPADRPRILLETLSGNESGRAFYASNGFEAVDRSTYTVGEESYPTVVLAMGR